MFYGAATHHSVDAYIDEYDVKTPEISTCSCKIPLKSGHVTHRVPNWVFFSKDFAVDEANVQKLYRTVSGKPRIYVDNTLEVLKELIKHAKERSQLQLAEKAHGNSND